MTAPQKQVSFSDKYEGSRDPGDNWKTFLAELFQENYPNIQAYETRGKDGAIDLFWEKGGKAIVWECKFIGKKGKAEAEKRWRKTWECLDKNLLQEGPKSGQIQYNPWYNKDQVIEEYRFCISSRLDHVSDRQALAQQIKKAFSTWARRGPKLAHLDRIKVEVVTWDEIEPKLASRVSLRHKWFPTNLYGLHSFDDWLKSHVGGIRSLLLEEHLPFYNQGASLSPQSILDALSQPQASALLVHGKGGCGKTRLLVETGRLASRTGWLVKRGAPYTFGIRGLEHLLQEAGGNKVLLLVDYFEEWKAKDEVLENLREYQESGIRLLTCCRPSALDIADPELPTRGLPEGDSNAITSHILSCIPDGSQFASVCRGIPVFAAFMLHLHRAGNIADLEELRKEREFGEWLFRRISFDRVEASRLLSSYPFDEAVLNAWESLSPELHGLHVGLKRDGWVQGVEGIEGARYETAHDLLADQLLLGVINDRNQRWDVVKRLLRDAVALQNIPSTVASLQRVADALQDLRWRSLLEGLQEDGKSLLKNGLLGSTAIPPEESLACLDLLDPQDTTIGDSLRAYLGRLARWVSKQTEDIRKVNGVRLLPWIRQSQRHHVGDPRVLAAGLLVSKEFSSEALEWLKIHGSQPIARGVLTAWLEGRHSLALITPHLDNWLQHHKHMRSAGFVFTAWLEAGGDTTRIEQSVKQWLEQTTNTTSIDASFVLPHWLRHKGPLSLVSDAILTWTNHEENALLPEASHVYKSWLEAGGKPPRIATAVTKWLSKDANRLSLVAHFVLSAWVKTDGDKDQVASAIADWLEVEENCRHPKAQFLFRAWLDAGGALDHVASAMSRWLEVNGSSPEASFVFKGWLDAQGGRYVVRDTIAGWFRVEQNRVSPDAGFIFSAWIRAGGEYEFIEENLHLWLEHGDNAIENGTSYIFNAFSRMPSKKLLPEALTPHACAWVRAHEQEFEAGSVIGPLIRTGPLDESTVSAIIRWCSRYSAHLDSMFRLKDLLWRQKGISALEVIPVAEKIMESRSPSEQWNWFQQTAVIDLLSSLDALINREDGTEWSTRLGILAGKVLPNLPNFEQLIAGLLPSQKEHLPQIGRKILDVSPELTPGQRKALASLAKGIQRWARPDSDRARSFLRAWDARGQSPAGSS